MVVFRKALLVQKVDLPLSFQWIMIYLTSVIAKAYSAVIMSQLRTKCQTFGYRVMRRGKSENVTNGFKLNVLCWKLCINLI